MTPAQQVAAWNVSFPVPCDVIYEGKRRQTRAAAAVLGDGRVVVWLDTYVGAVDLDSVKPI